MTDNETTVDKSIVEQLDFDAKTAKRVSWESWEFSVESPYQVRVTNAAYGFLKDEHSYVVGVRKCDGVPIPAECDCPADVHREPDCKHKLSLATVGGTTVLNAATEFTEVPASFPSSSAKNVTTGADKLQADGGAVTPDSQGGGCPNDDARCDGPDGDAFPCFDCFEVDQ